MDELSGLTARRAVEFLKKGEVSPLELIDAAEKRIAQVDPAVNALPTHCFDRAREEARRLMADQGGDRPPWFLHGLPVAIKDLEDVAGVRTTYGSPIYKDHIPETSDICVRMLEENGGLVLAKSNTPEFGAGANTFNEVFGATLNPWDTSKTCGGSSGGAAVALATGQAWLAQGSDMGGSLRIPASFCSVVGMRCSPGRVPRGPQKTPWQTLSVTGPMARNVADAALMLDAQVGQVRSDPISYPRPVRSYLDVVDNPVRPARLAFSPDLGLGFPVQAEVAQAVIDAAQGLERSGVAVEEACPDLSGSLRIFKALRAAAFVSGPGQLMGKHRDLLKPEIIGNVEMGLDLSCRDVIEAELARGELIQRVVSFFRRYDLLICPVVLCPPFAVEKRYLAELDGYIFEDYVDWMIMTFAITLTSCPAISIPGGFTEDGLPLGIQIVGPPRGEAEVLNGAALIEEMLGLAHKTPLDPRPPKEV